MLRAQREGPPRGREEALLESGRNRLVPEKLQAFYEVVMKRWEPSDMAGSYGMSSQEASVASKKMLNLQEKIEVLERMIEEQRLGAERDAPREGTEGGGGGGAREAAAREQAASTVPTPGLGAHSGMSPTTYFYRPSLTQSRPPKFDNIEAHFSTWHSKFEGYPSSLGCLHVLNTSEPVMVGDVRVSQEDLASRHSPQEIRDARLVYGLMMESMTGYVMAEFRMQEAMPPSGAWENWKTISCQGR